MMSGVAVENGAAVVSGMLASKDSRDCQNPSGKSGIFGGGGVAVGFAEGIGTPTAGGGIGLRLCSSCQPVGAAINQPPRSLQQRGDGRPIECPKRFKI